MSLYTIHVDKSREDRIFKELLEVRGKHPFHITADEFLDDGDIHVYFRHFLILIIERKRMKDFNESIKDGRLQNIYNLVQLSEEKKVALRKKQCILFSDQRRFMYPLQVLLVEGRFLRQSKHNFAPHVIQTYINQLRYHFPSLQIIRTTNIKESAQTILDLALDLPSDILNELHGLDTKTTTTTSNTNFQPPQLSFMMKPSERPAPLSKKRKRETVVEKKTIVFKVGDIRKHQYVMLRLLPGITIHWAKVFLENNITAMDLCVGIDERQLRVIRGGRPLGFFPRKNLDELKQICLSLDSRKHWLSIIFAKIPFVKSEPAKILAGLFLDYLAQNKELKIDDITPDKRIIENKIKPPIIQRVLTYWNFRPWDHLPQLSQEEKEHKNNDGEKKSVGEGVR